MEPEKTKWCLELVTATERLDFPPSPPSPPPPPKSKTGGARKRKREQVRGEKKLVYYWRCWTGPIQRVRRRHGAHQQREKRADSRAWSQVRAAWRAPVLAAVEYRARPTARRVDRYLRSYKGNWFALHIRLHALTCCGMLTVVRALLAHVHSSPAACLSGHCLVKESPAGATGPLRGNLEEHCLLIIHYQPT